MENNKMRKSQSNIVRRPLVNAWTDCIFIKTLFQETNPEKKTFHEIFYLSHAIVLFHSTELSDCSLE